MEAQLPSIPIVTKPRPFQKEGVFQMERGWGGRGRVLLADEMGLGKTFQALALHARNRLAGGMWPTLVVCNAAVKWGWQREARTHLDARVTILDGTRGAPPPLTAPSNIVVINYDILQYWVEYLKGCNFRFIVYDECQNLCNPTTKRAVAAKEISNGVPYVLAMSGTPLLNRPFDLFTVLNILLPDIFNSPIAFAMQYCRPRRKFGKWTFSGARNIPELHELLVKECMIRRLKEDVLSELPPLVRDIVPLHIDGMAEYNFARTDFKGWMESQGKAGRQAMRSQAFVRINYLRQLAARLKLKLVCEWVNSFLEESDKKLVIFAWHTQMIEALRRRCKAQSVSITGSVTGAARDAALVQFQQDHKTRLMINNLLAGGVGLNGMQGVCSNVVIAEFPWRWGDIDQAESRLHRMGAIDSVSSWWLVAVETIEEMMCEILQEKKETMEGLLDGVYDGGEDMGVFDLLMKKLGYASS